MYAVSHNTVRATGEQPDKVWLIAPIEVRGSIQVVNGHCTTAVSRGK